MRKINLLAAAISAALTSQVAIAQDSGTPRASGLTLEEVLVSAQRREQSLLDVPVAVSSLSSDALEEYAIDDVLDLAELNPSVSGITIANPMTSTDIRIRGIGTTGSNAGFESSVGIYVDDIYYSRGGLALVNFFDMDSVEIYRGPQGTLFGRNITAGAIMQRTEAPILETTTGYVQAELAEFGSQELEAAINIPIGANTAIRLSGIVDNTDGFMTNVITNDDAAAFTDTWGFRAQLLTEPTEDLSIRLIADTNSYESGRHYQQNNTLGPDGKPITLPTGQVLDRFDATTSYPSIATTEQFGFSGHIEYSINDVMDFKSITSVRHVDSENLDGDFDFSFADVAGDLDELQDMETFSQEFLLTFDTENAFITTGLHYFDEEIDFDRFNVNLTPTLGGGTFQNVNFNQTEESVGIFAHVDYTLTDQVSVIGGLRYSDVQKDIDFTNLLGTPEQVYNNIATDPALTAFFGGGGGADNAFPYSLSRSFDAITGDIALQFRPTDQIQAYIKYSRGFKAGGFNMNEAAAGGRPLPGISPTDPAQADARARLGATDILGNGTLFQRFDPDSAAYDEETIDSYEISVRYQMDRGLLAATYFDTEITDLQVGVFTGLNFETFNAPSGDASGLELEATYNVTEGLRVNAAVTLLDTEITSELSRPELIRGREFLQAPDTAFVVGASYSTFISDAMELNAAVNVSYHSDEFTRVNGCTDAAGNSAPFDQCLRPANINVPTAPGGNQNNAFFQNEGHYLANANLGVILNESLEVEVFCTNCTDEEHTIYNTFTPVVDIRSDYPGAPRIVGARARFNF